MKAFASLILLCFFISFVYGHFGRNSGRKGDKNLKITSISSRALTYGYSPHWDAERQSLYFVDNNDVEKSIFRYDFRTKTLYEAGFAGNITHQPSFIIPIKSHKNRFALSVERSVLIIEWDGKSSFVKPIRTATAVEQEAIYDDNDFDSGKVDPSGRLVAGTYRGDGCAKTSAANSSVYLFERDIDILPIIRGISSVAGLAWNPKLKKFYFLRSCLYSIYEYDWCSKTGSIRNQRTAYVYPKQDHNLFLVGLDIDVEGNLFVGLYNGSLILKVNPTTGKLLDTIKLPVETVTGLAFGGPKNDILFVTTAIQLFNFFPDTNSSSPTSSNPAAGQTFMIEGLNTKGPGDRKLPDYLQTN